MATTLNDGYLAAKQHWTERYGHLEQQVRNWRGVAVISGFATVLAICLAVFSAVRNPFLPFPVLIDRYGRTLGGGSSPALTDKEEETVRKGTIEAFIEDTRTVTSDTAMQSKILARAYSRVKQGSPAHTMLNEYFQAHSPYDTARTQTVSVRVLSLLQSANKTFEAEWTETARAVTSGGIQGTSRWRGVFTIVEAKPVSEEAAWANALGTYITHIVMSRQQEEKQQQ